MIGLKVPERKVGRLSTLMATDITKALLEDQEFRTKYRQEIDNISIEDITKQDFCDYMKKVLVVEPKERTTKDLDILERCTNYLEFFQDIRSLDTENNFDIIRKTCGVMLSADVPKGYFVLKFGDLPKEFFIILSGEVGVFLPRAATTIIFEMSTVERMMSIIGKPSAETEDIIKYINSSRLDTHRQEFLSNILRVREDSSIVFSDKYLNEMLGGVPLELLAENILHPVIPALIVVGLPQLLYKHRPRPRKDARRAGIH